MAQVSIKKEFWGKVDDHDVYLFTLENKQGTKAQFTNFGAHWISLFTADKNGQFTDVLVGKDSLEGLLKEHPFFGSIVGRYANRIANGKCQIDGKEYEFAINNGPNHLHGGIKGFDKYVWHAEALDDAVRFNMISPDGDEGYPGTLQVSVTYTLTEENEIKIDYHATTDKVTVINLTNHAYFNLKGDGTALNHLVELNASKYTPTGDTSIPTGELATVAGTPMDFTKSKPLGQEIDVDFQQLQFGHGYDHNYIIDKQPDELGFAAKVIEPESGRTLEVLTTEPGVQLYSANWIGGCEAKGGKILNDRDAFCLEAQKFPNSPNQPTFPSATLKPGETYRQTTIYKFGHQ
ncbi:aldose epimerase family protein [Limibacter armeniacum]|uniref:aldose epimerase family protein n=1 Tax=Limibacter armeniacum TaxID=466084 RepID=UPI002FE5D1DF